MQKNLGTYLMGLYDGMTSQGNPFCVVIKGSVKKDRFAVYNWDGGAWVVQSYLPDWPFGSLGCDACHGPVTVYTGEDYIILRGGSYMIG